MNRHSHSKGGCYVRCEALVPQIPLAVVRANNLSFPNLGNRFNSVGRAQYAAHGTTAKCVVCKYIVGSMLVATRGAEGERSTKNDGSVAYICVRMGTNIISCAVFGYLMT